MSAPIGRATLWDVVNGRRKRDSKRRWKARARLGQPIPMTAVVAHRLEPWMRALGGYVHDTTTDYAFRGHVDIEQALIRAALRARQ